MDAEIYFHSAANSVAFVLRMVVIEIADTRGVPSGSAKLAITTGFVQPRQIDRVALLPGFDPQTESRHDPGAFMPAETGDVGLDQPVAFTGVKVCVTHAVRCRTR